MEREISIYSEEEYVDKMYLHTIYSQVAAECIWKEILVYREKYRYPLYFDTKQYYLTMNPTLFHKMMKIYELKLEEQERIYPSIHLFIERNKCKSMKERMTLFLKENQLQMKSSIITFLCSDEILLVKLFIVCKFIKNKKLLYYILLENNQLNWYPMFDLQQKLLGINTKSDLTYEYRNFLEQLHLHLLDNMILWKRSNNDKEYSLNELILRFPMCSKGQLQFYMEHCNKCHYYTIAQYVHFHHVSYETARKAMNLLVSLRFYEKVKVGKKQVFQPL